MYELIEIGGIIFWAIILLWVLAIMPVSLRNEDLWLAPFWSIVFFGLVWLVSGFKITDYIFTTSFVYYSLAYLGLGIFYALIKYRLLAQKVASYLKAGTLEKRYKNIEGDADYKYGSEIYHLLEDKSNLDVAQYKSKISYWMIYWPWSLLGSIIFEWIERAFSYLVDSLKGLFASVAKGAFKE